MTPEMVEKVKLMRTRFNDVVEKRLFDMFIIELLKLREEVAQLKAKAVEDSWERSPDRMGGQFTGDEIRAAYENRLGYY